MNASLKDRVPAPIKRGYKAIRNPLRQRRAVLGGYASVLSRRLKFLTKPVLFQAKQSENLFILGSGASTNAFTEAQWRAIRDGDSLGMNDWILQDHVPTFYSGEFADPIEFPGIVDDYRYNLRIAAPGYRDCVSFFRFRNRNVLENADVIRAFRGRIALQKWVGGRTEGEVGERIRKIDLRRRGYVTELLHYSTSVDTGVMLGAYLGYKRIILCGVDLNNVKYFYHESAERFTSRGFRVPDTGQQGTVHRSNDPSQLPVLLPMVLRHLQSHPGIPKLYVAHTGSALYPEIALYPW